MIEFMWPFQDRIGTKNATDQDITTRIECRVRAIIPRETK
jgi:hypothetical protein